MNKIKEVIERIKATNRMFAEENELYSSRCIENNNIAIAALEEKLERSKGCEYCMEQKHIALDYNNDHVAIRTDNGEPYMEGADWDEDIYYCPMCGRKLGDESES